MEVSLGAGSMCLKAKQLAAFDISNVSWKTGGRGTWGLSGSLMDTARITKAVQRKGGVVTGVFSSSEGRLGCAVANLDRAGGLRWVDYDDGTRRTSTAVGAGRSKAKKGQSSGGRIERRPGPAFRRLRPDRSRGGKDGGANMREGDEVPKRGSGSSDPEEEDLNLTWESAGLGDRRSKGRYQGGTAPRPREPILVGGWGKDKSMQREISPEQQRSGALSRSNSAQKIQNPAVPKKKKKKWYEGFDDDPNVEHPPDYYKYGPFGPFAWKGIPVGTAIGGTFATINVVYFSNVKDDAEDEDREKANVAADYSNAVDAFDQSVGIKYYYAFARKRFGPRKYLWKDWTLVAQIAIEAGDVIGEKGEIFRKMGMESQNITTRCVAWARPDITYVRKPMAQLRFEPQEDFLKELFHLLDPSGDGDGNDSDSYYQTLCKLLDVDLEASPREVRSAYDTMEEEGRLECLKHVFTRHPVKVLSNAGYDDRQVWEHRGSNNVDEMGARGETGHNFEQNSNLEGLEVVDKGGNVSEGGEQRQPAEVVSALKLSSHAPGTRGSRQEKTRLYTEPAFRSAVRPYSYANIIEEIAEIRSYLCRKKLKISRLLQPL